MMTDPTSAGTVLDLFAGPGGWSYALATLGLREIGIELDAVACATRRAAGHATIRADVASLPVTHLRSRVKKLIGSPPCQGYSAAGLQEGLADIDLCHRVLDDLARGEDTRSATRPRCADSRSLLVVEPLRYALAIRPDWIALEQVPAVLPLWQHTANLLRAAGYWTWAGILNAADYGVPQTRRRAILIASLNGPVSPPEPTHAREAEPPSLFGPGRLAWVSMAQALDWDTAPTVATRGNYQGNGGHTFDASGPSWTLTNSTRTWSLRVGNQSRATVRGAFEPAPTLLFGHALNDVSVLDATGVPMDRLSIPQASLLQSFPPDYPWAGSRTRVFEQIGNAVPPLLASAVIRAASMASPVSRNRLAVAA
jgi:DNA (cytosine-5)-methyltransferase 1